MVCNSCNKSTNISKDIQISSLGNISQEQLISLYQQGYTIPERTSINYNTLSNFTNSTNSINNIKSLGFQDVSSWQYLWTGLFSYGAYVMYKNHHNVLAIILGAFALGSAGKLYYNLQK